MKQALLIIDAQQALVETVFQKEKLLENVNKVIQKALQAEADIIFIRDTDVGEGKGAGFEIHSDITVPQIAKVFDKTATNAFYKTPLLAYLTDREVRHIVMMGCKTEHCVDTTVRTATVQHFDVTLVADGHSTTDSNAIPAETIIKHHNETLHGHYNIDNFSVVRPSDEDLFDPIHDNYRD
ncbi:isochorismatase family protein [Shimazuella kribbensis]|uniref:isochorismatase family protein n=1 Tax=Shimazuella kribbensis TaxID=139808 RepID=UPI00041B4D2C|nr:isochorismatase family protein [Shimazuella kribbensis]